MNSVVNRCVCVRQGTELDRGARERDEFTDGPRDDVDDKTMSMLQQHKQGKDEIPQWIAPQVSSVWFYQRTKKKNTRNPNEMSETENLIERRRRHSVSRKKCKR